MTIKSIKNFTYPICINYVLKKYYFKIVSKKPSHRTTNPQMI